MMQHRRLVLCLLAATANLYGLSPQSPVESPPLSPFARYTTCNVPQGPNVVETAPLAAGVSERTVKTFKGPYTIPMVAGRRMMFAYDGEDFYANVKVELLPAQSYATSRTALIDDFDVTLAGDDTVRNYKLKPTLNGFDIRGLDRTRREGGVLGIYLLFDDPARTVSPSTFSIRSPQSASTRSTNTLPSAIAS